jgi:ribose/xylose/arabinose/galactoside ABC-type transport system permease subunit
VTRLKLPPFIVTLGTLSVFTALGILYTKGQSIRGSDMPDIMSWTGNVIRIGDFVITYGVVMAVALYVVVGFVLAQTMWGRHVYAVGDDAEAARLAGIPVNRVLVSVYAVAGLIYGLTAWIQIGRADAASPNAITDGNLETITAVVIGGTSLFGGRGNVRDAVVGALLIAAIANGIDLVGYSSATRFIVTGLILLAAVTLDTVLRRRQAAVGR